MDDKYVHGLIMSVNMLVNSDRVKDTRIRPCFVLSLPDKKGIKPFYIVFPDGWGEEEYTEVL